MNCILLGYKIDEDYIGKTTKLHKLFIKNKWSWKEVRVLVKQGLVGVQNGGIVTRGDLETIRLQLAASSRYYLENG